GNNNSFRTDSAISGGRTQGERPLQRWVPDAQGDVDGSLESSNIKSTSSTGGWDQFAENEKRFGLTTDYRDEIYTTAIDKSHPQYKQRLADADRKAKEIERSVATNSHVAEERIRDNLSKGDNGLDEEDRYSGVRRQDFPPLSSSNNNKYTPPAKRPPTGPGQATVAGAPIDPAIISLSKPADKVKPAATPTPKEHKTEIPIPSTTAGSTTTTDLKPKPVDPPAANTSRTASPHVKPDGVPNHTATVERDVATAFKTFANNERKNVQQHRTAKARSDKEIKLNDLKKFADSFKLHTPVPSDLISIIAKDPQKQKAIQEKAKRNAEEASAQATEAVKIPAPAADNKASQRPTGTTHGTPPSNLPNRQGNGRNPNYQPNHLQSYRPNDRPLPQGQQNLPHQQFRPQPGNPNNRSRQWDNKQGQMQLNPIPVHDPRPPPTGPSNLVDPNFSRRSSGVGSAQGRLNPNSSEFRPSPHAPTFNPNGNPSTGSSPRSAATVAESAPPVVKSLLKGGSKPVADSERPSIAGKFNAMEYIISLKPPAGKDWKATGGLKPAYETPPVWRIATKDDTESSTIHMNYAKLFEMTPFPPQTLSPIPPHAVPQVAHQYQLPPHLQHGGGPRPSPRPPHMNLHAQHGPNASFNGADDHRMVPSQSAQSYTSPRMQNAPLAFPSPSMNGAAQMAYNPQMMYPGAPPMQQYRSLSQSHQFMPQQPHMGQHIMMQNPGPGFMTSQGMAPAPHMVYPQGQGHFIPAGNGPPVMPGVNGYPSPGRGAPMMMSQGSQQGHQQQMYGGMNPGMSPGPTYGNVNQVYGQPQQSRF
ncbi:hypothetical protein B0O99DRAFT_483889, partial [Bisporella sp. PMI_857]